MKKQILQKDFVEVSLENDIYIFDWEDACVDQEVWKGFRKEYVNHPTSLDKKKIMVLNNVERQEVMSFSLLEDLKESWINTVEQGKEMFIAFVTGNSMIKKEEVENIMQMVNDNRVNVKSFNNSRDGLDWLNENKQ